MLPQYETGGGPGGACEFWDYQLTLFEPRGADYARHITTGPPIFWDDAASLKLITNVPEPILQRT